VEAPTLLALHDLQPLLPQIRVRARPLAAALHISRACCRPHIPRSSPRTPAQRARAHARRARPRPFSPNLPADGRSHHCPWIGSCVAQSNHRFFASFVLFIGLAGATVPISAWLAYLEAAPARLPVSRSFPTGTPQAIRHAAELSISLASSSALMGFLALCTTCYCGTLACFGFASWAMLLCDTTTKERFGRERVEVDCNETCHDIYTGEWQREMGVILCGPVRCRDH
jgi:hypothetical protein